MKVNNVLLTGAAGNIGQILWKDLSKDFSLYGLDIKRKENQLLQKADIARLEDVTRVFQEFPPIDCIVHLAADANEKAGWDSVLKNNILGTRNIYDCAHRFGIPKIVFASSGHVVGGYEKERKSKSLITVNAPFRPDGFYALSKAFGELLARFYFDEYGIRSIILRIGYVPRDDDPTRKANHQSIWLSHRDLVQLVRLSILSDRPFGIYFGVSNNQTRFWDISNACQELGYAPKDDASKR